MSRAAPLLAFARRPIVRRALKLLFFAALLALTATALRRVDFHAVLHHVRALPHATIVAALALSLAQVLVLATRLWSVFPRHARPSWALVARAFGFGQFVNTYMPGRAGDVVKVLAIAQQDDGASAGDRATPPRASVADATGVMLADKGLDVLSLVALVIVFGHGVLRGVVAGAHAAPWILVAVAAAIAISLLVMRRFFPALLAKVRAGAGATARAARAMLTPKRLAGGMGLALLAWVAEVTLMLVLASAMGLHLTFAQATVGLLVLNLGIAVPISVANVGAYEAATVVGLAPFGASATQALAIGTLHHAMQLAAIVLFALVFWLRDRFTGATRAPAAAPSSAG